MIVLPLPWRLWATHRLLCAYRVDEYLTDPAARRLWIGNFALAFLAPIGLVLLGAASGIWWVAMWLSIFAVLFTWRIAWKVQQRVSRLEGSSWSR